jgi:CheY-like chemotaxis protein
MTATGPLILIVEDNPTDVLLIKRAIGKAGLTHPLAVIPDGDAAVAYLAGTGAYADRRAHPLPGLILLDLKLPRRSGLEVLQWLKQEPPLRRIPVVVLTSSAENRDIARAYDLGANSYLVKPVVFDELHRMMERVDQYWLRTNVPPNL